MSSSSSDDDEMEKFKDSIDTSIFGDHLYKSDRPKPTETIKSNRYLENHNNCADMRISADMQKRVGEKISNIINKKIKYVDTNRTFENPILEGGVKLFTDSENFIDPNYIEVIVNTKPKKKKRRTIDQDSISDDEKIKMSVITPESVISKAEIKHWKSKKKQKCFEYKKSEDGTFVLNNVVNKFEYS